MKKMIRTVVKIEGMACGMCEAHICEVIRRVCPEAKKVEASRTKKEASFISENPVSKDELIAAINETGYTALSVTDKPYEKKSLFSFK